MESVTEVLDRLNGSIIAISKEFRHSTNIDIEELVDIARFRIVVIFEKVRGQQEGERTSFYLTAVKNHFKDLARKRQVERKYLHHLKVTTAVTYLEEHDQVEEFPDPQKIVKEDDRVFVELRMQGKTYQQISDETGWHISKIKHMGTRIKKCK